MEKTMPKKRIPQTLDECTQMNETASTLYAWSSKIDLIGQILFVLLLFVGAIVTITAISSASDDARLSTVLINVGIWALIALFEYFVHHVVVLMIHGLASITQQTAVTADVALYEANKKENSDT